MLVRPICSGPSQAVASRAISSRCVRAPCLAVSQRPAHVTVPSARLMSSGNSNNRNSAVKVPHQRILTIFDDPTTPSYKQRTQFDAAPSDPRITVLRTVDQVRAWTADVSSSSSSKLSSEQDHDAGVALIPTMGALHQGHLDLIRAAAQAGHDKIVVSIYVNPAQFGVSEDLDSYPKTWDADCAALAKLRPELEDILSSSSSNNNNQQEEEKIKLAIFAPTTPEMYPSGFPGQEIDSDGSFITITPVGAALEGQTRPTFFRGVATVCMKLFNIVAPSRVFFGQKDIQQTVVIRKMVRDFRLPIDVVVSPTTREEPDNELALSSRNVYLGPRRRAVAPVLVRALRAGEAAYLEGGLRSVREIVPAALSVILEGLEEQSRLPASEGVLFELDYIALRDPDTFAELDEVDPSKGAILCGAIKMLPVFEAQEGEDLGQSGGPPVRLIDNLVLPPIPGK